MRKSRLALIYGMAAVMGLSSLTACGKKAAEEETTVAANIDPITGQEIVETEAVTEAAVEETEATEAPKQEIKIELGKETEAATEVESKASDFTPVQSDEGRWQKSNNGWTFIMNDTNEVAKQKAVEIDGTVYYFDADGNMANKGWAVDSEGVWRYVQNGKYKTGWIDGKYYTDENGMKTGLCEIEGKKYLMKDTGEAVDGWEEVSGKWYYAEKGKLAIGVTKIEDATYGFDTDGAMLTGEAEINGKKYMFNDDGIALTGLVDTANGKVYCDAGEVQTGKVEVNGTVLAFKEDGTLDANKFVNGVYINADGTADTKKRVTNIGAFADKDGIDKLLNGLPTKLVDEMFTQNGWKLIYDATVKGSMEEIEGSGAVSMSGKFLKFHNLDTVGHRFGHYINFMTNGAKDITAIRTEEFSNLGWDEYFGKSDNEYFSEACGQILLGKFDKEKAPKTYEYISNLIDSRYK